MDPKLLHSKGRCVIKLGTRVLTDADGRLHLDRIRELCRQMAAQHVEGQQLVVVSSGAVGLGMGRLGLSQRPRQLALVQACAAVGQSVLTETWQTAFSPFGIKVAQVLLTRDDLTVRRRHIAARELFSTLLEQRIVPIVNENDAISADELRFGDNDILSALVASLIKADALVILSTAPGLIDVQGDGQVIPRIERIEDRHRALAGGPGNVTSTGGMVTKLQAAEIATRSGCATLITSGGQSGVLDKALGTGLEAIEGTVFLPGQGEMSSRRRHLAFFERHRGAVTVDDGAVRALQSTGASLLAKGCLGIDGDFVAGDVLAVLDLSGLEIARGRSQWSSAELAGILGKGRAEIAEQFPDRPRLEVIHRDDLVIGLDGAVAPYEDG